MPYGIPTVSRVVRVPQQRRLKTRTIAPLARATRSQQKGLDPVATNEAIQTHRRPLVTEMLQVLRAIQHGANTDQVYLPHQEAHNNGIKEVGLKTDRSARTVTGTTTTAQTGRSHGGKIGITTETVTAEQAPIHLKFRLTRYASEKKRTIWQE